MLGQGNRTALPICGYFLGSVLNDPTFKQYRCKFADPRDPQLNDVAYNCGGYYQAPSDSDSIGVDSMAVNIPQGDEIFYDDFGNPLPRPGKAPTPDDATEEPVPHNNAEATDEE